MARLSSELVIRARDQASGPIARLRGVLGGLRGEVARTERIGIGGLGMLRGVIAAAGAYVGVREAASGTIGAALKFETALSDVRKVVDASDEQFANMRQSILGLSKQMPVTAEGFASIYAAAAQSGVAQEDLKAFSEGVVQMSTAWDTAVDATGESLAKIKTALGRDIKGTMALGDAINHVSNVSAASAPDMLEYTNRVAAFAETAGFSAEQALAFGAAMVGSGFAPEVAATSFRNLTSRIAKGTKATKEQRTAFKQLGLDAVKVAKGMQKNAVATTLDVLDRVKKLPEWQQISVANALFGEEARGLAPLIRDSTELRRLLTETGDAAKYAGSAYKEYIVRAQTTGNVLSILRNKVADVFRGMGDDMLPSVKEAALGLGDVLDTLGNRAGVFDEIGAGIKGFAKGLGFEGGIREAVNGLGDLLFGKDDGSGAADRLGRIFSKAEGWGASLRSLNEAIKDSPVLGFLSSVGGYGLQLAVASVGMAVFAGAVRTLAGALYFLSGAKAAVGILQALGRGGKWLANATTLAGGAAEIAEGAAGRRGGKTAKTAADAAKTGAPLLAVGSLATGVLAAVSGAFLNLAQSDTVKTEWEKERERYLNDRIRERFSKPDASEDELAAQPGAGPSARGRKHERKPAIPFDEGDSVSQRLKRFLFGAAADPGFNFREHMRIETGRDGDRRGVFGPLLRDLPRATVPAYEPPRTRGGVSDVRPMPTGPVSLDTAPAETQAEQLASRLADLLQIDGRANFDTSAIDIGIAKAQRFLNLVREAGRAQAGAAARLTRADYSGLQSDLEYSVS
jgi:TP901 family phage tail tape measure protein